MLENSEIQGYNYHYLLQMFIAKYLAKAYQGHDVLFCYLLIISNFRTISSQGICMITQFTII